MPQLDSNSTYEEVCKAIGNDPEQGVDLWFNPQTQVFTIVMYHSSDKAVRMQYSWPIKYLRKELDRAESLEYQTV